MTRSSARFGIAVAFALCLGSSAGLAQEHDSALKSVMKMLGFATDLGPPADFVIQSRPKGESDYVPVFRPPPEPARPVLNDKQLQAVKTDLDAVEKRDDVMRRSSPAAKNEAAKGAPAQKRKAKPAAANHQE
jgi:hypothetical protein